MRTIGLLGGMSWESTTTYYRIINQEVGRRLGGLHSAELCLYSVEFAEIERLQHAGDWVATAEILLQAGKRLQRAGADFLVICTNTMHRVADQLERNLDLPLLHIADATAETIAQAGIGCVGLLGTRFTMEQDFYKDRLSEHHRLRVLTPPAADREIVHQVIFQELCRGELKPESKSEYLRIITELRAAGAEAVILGCTEIALLVPPGETEVKLFDTTEIHAKKAVDWALSNSPLLPD